MSIVTFEKPMEHVPLDEYNKRLWNLQVDGDNYRDKAFALRHSARQLRNDSNLKSKWDTYFNDLRLQDRLMEVSRWREVLETCLKQVQEEISKVKEEKTVTDIALETVVNTPLTVVSECLTLRDGRHGDNLNHDESYMELINELEVVEALKTMLSDRCQSSWEQLNRLAEAEFRLQLDLNNKTDAIEIDSYNLEMDRDCSGTTYKPDPLRIPNNCIPYQKWLEISQMNKLNMENEISTAIKLRESMKAARDRAFNALKAQHDVTNFTLRKTVANAQRAKNELQWQEMKLSNEMDKTHKELLDLEVALNDKADGLKLAQTRLENRMFRGGPELVQDAAQDCLAQEVLQLRQTKLILEDKIYAAKKLYNDLEQHLVRVRGDLDNKNHSLMTDLRCLDTRKRLKKQRISILDPIDPEDFQLTRMVEEIPKSIYIT